NSKLLPSMAPTRAGDSASSGHSELRTMMSPSAMLATPAAEVASAGSPLVMAVMAAGADRPVETANRVPLARLLLMGKSSEDDGVQRTRNIHQTAVANRIPCAVRTSR